MSIFVQFACKDMYYCFNNKAYSSVRDDINGGLLLCSFCFMNQSFIAKFFIIKKTDNRTYEYLCLPRI